MLNVNLLEKLVNADAIAGNEKEVRDIFKTEVITHSDNIIYDGLGSIIAQKGKSGKKILFASHMDEVGFMVTKITEKGFIEFQTIGGWWAQVMLAQPVRITTRTGQKIKGVTGSKPPHVLSPEVRNKVYEIKDMFIDIGASSRKEAEDWGIRPGDMITPDTKFERLNNSKLLLAKAWDNRIGTAAVIEAFKQLSQEKLETQLFVGGNVQEEVGLRGATTATHLVNPDIAFAVDTGTAGDTPGMTSKEADSILGAGPQIFIYDASMLPQRELLNFVTDLADQLEIPYQLTVIAGGGTDAGKMHLTKNGIPSLALAVPVRYLHSANSIIHEDDYLNLIKLIVAIGKHLNTSNIHSILNYE
ncbi:MULTISPECIES: M42 family metallopeptidase [unclassified Enterococcus]|uniref:M42 family metallopeptidase n=1 Tax=unclassified Enterococcus TaxID=2608891 RepID=UPI0015522A1B|nr:MULTISPECIES: M42 family metallopeptidase [unclassified Enterococcus]MBS7577581.1 M42 family metallopeptidase [Enterococcus sp. MMGLQ5-2]MBS7584920.1 M42 family metallopeptidase [Enterococcus sp. MMGLQ5-1]NPD12775.1 M42 family metallopeptidase [Enterococcus sp. MMGLQ5-1]NPD37414.1 M42 family metallopeptidase [Enterococcus sp. MMGLQ5-2]